MVSQAGIECDEVEKTGRVKAKCKEETLKRLTKHDATKEVFQVKSSSNTVTLTQRYLSEQAIVPDFHGKQNEWWNR